VVTLAENQRPIAEGLQQGGLVRWIGHKDSVSEDCIREALAEFVEQDLDEGWSIQCHNTVDGRGVHGVSAVLTITSDTPLQARHARLSDEKLILSWANDPETRRQSFSSAPISLKEHRLWFRDRLRDIDACKFFIVEAEVGIPIGQVRFEKKEGIWEIDYTLDPHLRKRGLGRSLLEVALRTLRSECSSILVFGRVKEENIPSRKVFESLGFESKRSGGGVEYQRLL
jgi:RimJ/RimL family protein N-acetyltransferase